MNCGVGVDRYVIFITFVTALIIKGMREHLKRAHIAGMISVVVFNVYMNELWGQLLCLMMLSL